MSYQWWVATSYGVTVQPVEITGHTDKTVTLAKSGRRQAKDSTSEWVRPTFEEARQCLVEYWEAKVESAKRSLEYAASRLGTANELKP